MRHPPTVLLAVVLPAFAMPVAAREPAAPPAPEANRPSDSAQRGAGTTSRSRFGAIMSELILSAERDDKATAAEETAAVPVPAATAPAVPAAERAREQIAVQSPPGGLP